jgi:hypothetical protein
MNITIGSVMKKYSVIGYPVGKKKEAYFHLPPIITTGRIWWFKLLFISDILF